MRILLQPEKLQNVFCIAVFLCCFTFGCTFIPEQEQFITAGLDQSLVRSAGNCREAVFSFAGLKTCSTLAGLNPDSISLLDWNLYKEQRQGWADDFVRLSVAKDIIVLQEASLIEKLQQLLHQNKMYWHMNSAFKYGGVETGVLVASRIQPAASCGMRQSEPIIGLPKTTLLSWYCITGSPYKLLVANIHGINITLGVGAYKKQLDDLQDVLQKHEGPLILVGDFNNWSDKRSALVDILAGKLSLRVLVFDDEGRTTFFGDPVDHVLYRGLEPVVQAVHHVISSDHNPISVTFSIVRAEDGID